MRVDPVRRVPEGSSGAVRNQIHPMDGGGAPEGGVLSNELSTRAPLEAGLGQWGAQGSGERQGRLANSSSCGLG